MKNSNELEDLDLPQKERTYLQQLVDKLKSDLDDRLCGVYLFGSAAYAAYQPGKSDFDVQAIIKDNLTIDEKKSLAASLSHNVFPCPARRLEFVLYTLKEVNPVSRHPKFELNFNSGSDVPSDHLSTDPSTESSHWFLLDVALGRNLGLSLYGPSPKEIFSPISRQWTLEGILDSLEWHNRNEALSTNSVLNACRGWRYAVENVFGSKIEGGKWALEQKDCPDVVQKAIKYREDGDGPDLLDSNSVKHLIAIISNIVRNELDHELEKV